MPQPKKHDSIQMLMADVDGTLVTPQKDLTERAIQAVTRLRYIGKKFTMISSRPPYGMRSLVDALEVSQPIVAFNGGMLVTQEGKTIYQYELSPEIISQVLSQLQQYGLSPRLYTPQAWYINSPHQPHMEHETCTIETRPTVVDDFSPDYKQVVKMTGVSDDYEAVSACQKSLSRLLGDKASVLCSQRYYLDITHQLANKGHAVELIAQWEKLSKHEIAVIGDMPSDVPMFKQAGLSIAMGNANLSVQKQADFVTDTDANDGFAKAIENYILNPIAHLV